MNTFKKGLLALGVSITFTGLFTVNQLIEVEAAEWEARTVEEIKEDIKNNHIESSYTIQWGDTLGTIATAFDLPLNKIAQVNEIANIDYIVTGNVLRFSADQKTVSLEDTTTNEVKSYDVSSDQVKEVSVPKAAIAAVQEPAPVQEAPSQVHLNESETEAKAWIAFKESTDNYYARNGKYIGKYQLTDSYLNGDFSPENQERVADQYVVSRYGSWVAAKQFWLQNGWY